MAAPISPRRGSGFFKIPVPTYYTPAIANPSQRIVNVAPVRPNLAQGTVQTTPEGVLSSRTWGETAADAGIRAATQAGGLLSAGLSVFGAADPNAPLMPERWDGKTARGLVESTVGMMNPLAPIAQRANAALESGTDYLQGLSSDKSKQAAQMFGEQDLAEKAALAAAPYDGFAGRFGEEMLREAKHAGRKIVADPTGTLGDAAGSAIPFMGVGKVASGLGITAKAMAPLLGVPIEVGSVKQNIAQTVQQAPVEDLMSNPTFAADHAILGEERARQNLANKAASYFENPAAIGVGAVEGYFLSKLGADAALLEAGGASARKAIPSLVKQAGRGRLKSGLIEGGKELWTEGLQEGLTQAAGNVGAASGGAKIDPMQGVVESTVQGAAIGAPGGFVGGFGEPANARRELARMQAETSPLDSEGLAAETRNLPDAEVDQNDPLARLIQARNAPAVVPEAAPAPIPTIDRLATLAAQPEEFAGSSEFGLKPDQSRTEGMTEAVRKRRAFIKDETERRAKVIREGSPEEVDAYLRDSVRAVQEAATVADPASDPTVIAVVLSAAREGGNPARILKAAGISNAAAVVQKINEANPLSVYKEAQKDELAVSAASTRQREAEDAYYAKLLAEPDGPAKVVTALREADPTLSVTKARKKRDAIAAKASGQRGVSGQEAGTLGGNDPRLVEGEVEEPVKKANPERVVAPSAPAEPAEVGGKALPSTERVDAVFGAGEQSPTGETRTGVGPVQLRDDSVSNPSPALGESDGLAKKEGVDGHGESLRSNIPVLDEFLKPEINKQGVGPTEILGKLVDHPGYRGIVESVRGKSPSEAVKILADAELADWLFRPTMELAGLPAPTSKEVRAAVQEVSDRKQDEYFQSQRPDVVSSPPAFEGQRGAPFVKGKTIPGAEDRLSFIQRTAAERGNAPEIFNAKLKANKAIGGDLAAALRGESAPVEAPGKQEAKVSAQSEAPVFGADQGGTGESVGAVRPTEPREVRPEPLNGPQGGVGVAEFGKDLVADDAPKFGATQDAESLPAKAPALFVQIGNKRFEVKSYEDASKRWNGFRDAAVDQGAKGEGLPSPIIVDQDGNQVARIAQNGKIFPPAADWRAEVGQTPLYDPSKPKEAKAAPKPDLKDSVKPTPEPVKDKGNEPKAERPSLGDTAREVMAEWRKLEAYPREQIVAHVPAFGNFIMENDGTLMRSVLVKTKSGTVSTLKPMTAAELDTFNEELSKGRVQIEGQAIRGAMGVREFSDAGKTMRVYHQATGVPLGEAAAPVRDADGLTKAERLDRDLSQGDKPEQTKHEMIVELLGPKSSDYSAQMRHADRKRAYEAMSESDIRAELEKKRSDKARWAQRDTLIARIVEAAKQPTMEIRERFELKGTDGNWYRGDMPRGVNLASPVERRTYGFAYQTPKGTFVGTIGKTREELEERQEKREKEQSAAFAATLRGKSDEELQSQAEYWLKEPVDNKKTIADMRERLRTKSPAEVSAKPGIDALKARVTAAKENLERVKAAQELAKGKRDKAKIQPRIDALDKEYDAAQRALHDAENERLKIEGDPAQKLIAGKKYADVDAKALLPIVTEAVEANEAAKELTSDARKKLAKSLADGQDTSFYWSVKEKGLAKAVDIAVDIERAKIATTKAVAEIEAMEGLIERTGYGQKSKQTYIKDVRDAYRVEDIDKAMKAARADNESGLEKKREDDRVAAQQAEMERQRVESLKDPVSAEQVAIIQKLTIGEYNALKEGVSEESPFRMAAMYPTEQVLKRLGARGLVEKQMDPLTKTEEYVGTLTKAGQEMAKAVQRYDARLKNGIPFAERGTVKGRWADAFDKGSSKLVIGKVDGRDVHSSGHWLVEGPRPAQAEGIEVYQELTPERAAGSIAPRKKVESIRPVAYFETDRTQYVVMSNGSAVNASYFDYVSGLHPDAEFFGQVGENDTPVYLKAKGRYVGVIMPIRHEASPGVQAILDAKPAEAEAKADTARQRNLGEDEKPAEPERPKEAPKPAIQDVGEKFGGARKDLAEKTGPRGEKVDDDRPAWEKRFKVSQTVSSSDPTEKGKWQVLPAKTDRFNFRPLGTFDTKEQAEAFIPIAAVSESHLVYKGGDGTFKIERKIGDRKLVQVVKQTFDTREEAMAYMAAHAEEILGVKTNFGEEVLPRPDPNNVQRIGAARRDGDVNENHFKDTFGFRGVEFGKWEAQDERQTVMNHAYDSLLDLAETLGIPPKAISLNGDLGLAFGSRGHGLTGAMAHYERDYGVINLTKMKGAGALAHEWFHSLDHYFGRQRSANPNERVENKRGDKVFKENAMVTEGGYLKGVREEVTAKLKTLLSTMQNKAAKFVEDTQKVEKWVGQTRDDLKKRLDSLRNNLAAPNTYSKNKKAPASAEQLARFDALAEQIINGEALTLEAKYRAPQKGRAGSIGTVRWTNAALEEISGLLKSVRGYSGFAKDTGPLTELNGYIKRYAERLEQAKSAAIGEEKTRSVPTQFAMNARSADQGRVKGYWSTPVEMAARAFQSYVEDRLSNEGAQNDFLTFGTKDAVILTPWGAVRPYPLGDERTALNAAFDDLFKTIQTKETDKGVALFERPRSSDIEGERASVGVLPGDEESASLEGNPHVSLADTKALRDVFQGNAFRMKGLGGLDIPTRDFVLKTVMSMGKNLQVGDSIVELVPVDVMNVLRSEKLPPEMLFHDPSVLEVALSANRKLSVPAWRDMADALMRVVAGRRTEANERLSGLRDIQSGKRRLALDTNGVDSVSHRITIHGEVNGRDQSVPESVWKHYNGLTDDAQEMKTDYRDGQQVSGAAPGVRVVDFKKDVPKELIREMAKTGSTAALASKISGAVDMIRRHVPDLVFGGVTPAGSMHGVNVNGKVFINFLATHQIAIEAVKKERITYAEAFARELFNVLAHEAAHYREKGHGTAFEAEMARIISELGPQAKAAILRDFRRYASEEKNRANNNRMYEKALPGWREGERRGREAARADARTEGRSGADAEQLERLPGKPRSDTGSDSDAREDDGRQGRLPVSGGREAGSVAAPAFVRGSDGEVALPSVSDPEIAADVKTLKKAGFVVVPDPDNTALVMFGALESEPFGEFTSETFRSYAEEDPSMNKVFFAAGRIEDHFNDRTNAFDNARGGDPDFSRKPSADDTPAVAVAKESNSDRLFRAFMKARGADIGPNETKLQYLQRKGQNRLNSLDRAESAVKEKRGDTSAPALADHVFGAPARIDNKLLVAESLLLTPIVNEIKANGLNFDTLGGYMKGDETAIKAVEKSGKKAQYDASAQKIEAIYDIADDYRLESGLVTKADLEDIQDSRAAARAESTTHPIYDALQDLERAIIDHEHNLAMDEIAKFAEKEQSPDFATVGKVPKEGPTSGAVTFRRGGQKLEIRFADPLVAQSVKNLYADRLEGFTRLVSGATRWTSRINTILSPTFAVKNKIRDYAGVVLSAMVLNGAPNGIAKSVAWKIASGQLAAQRGTAAFLKNPAKNFEKGSDGWWAKQAHANAAVPGYFKSVESLQRLESRLGDTLRSGLAKKMSLRHFSDVMMGISQISEASTRVSVYRALVEAGETPQRAGAIARNTLDTNKSGEWTRNIGALTPFFNSSVQGAARLIQMITSSDPAVKKRARMMLGGLVASGFALGAWLAAAGGDDDKDGIPDSDQHAEWDDQRNLLIGGAKIPLPQGFSAPFYAGYVMSKLSRGNAKPAAAAANVAKAFWDQFTPISSPFGVAQPVADILQNKTFTGSPIRPIRYPGQTKPNSEMFFKSNSGASKAIAKGLNKLTGGDEAESGRIDLSPGDIDYVAKAGLGALGKFMSDSYHAAEALAAGKPSVKSLPVLKDFLVDENRNIQSRYYDAAQAIKDADDRRRGKEKIALKGELIDRNPAAEDRIDGASLTELKKALRASGANLSPERRAWLIKEMETEEARSLRAKDAFKEAHDRLKALENMPDGQEKDDKKRAIYEMANRAFVAAVKGQ